MKFSLDNESWVEKQRHLLAAALIFLIVLGFYFYTMQPSLAWGDGVKIQLETITGESFIQSALPDDLFTGDPYPFAKVGVAAWDHPLHTIIGHTLVRLAPNLHAPWLVNSISSVFGAATIAVLFLLSLALTQSYPASILATLLVAVSHTFWFHSVTAEVYTLSAFLILLSIYLVDRYERTRRFRYLIASAFFLGLGVSNHLMAFLAIPALIIYLLNCKARRNYQELSPGQILLLGFVFLVGCAPYMIQFARMLRVFSLSEALGPVVGSVFLRELLATTPAIILTSIINYLIFLVYQFTPIGVPIGGYGLILAFRDADNGWLKMLIFYLVYTTFGIFYRVTDQFAFFMLSHIFFGTFIALGIRGLASMVSSLKRVAIYALFGILIAIIPIFYSQMPLIAEELQITDRTFGIPQIGTDIRNGMAYYLVPDKHSDMQAYQFGQTFFSQVPENSLIIAEWYTDTDEFFVFQYFSIVERMRPDVDIEGWPLKDPFNFDADLAVQLVEEQIQKRPVFLASLSDEFYNANQLMTNYCIVPELNLYRVYPSNAAAQDVRAEACMKAEDMEKPENQTGISPKISWAYYQFREMKGFLNAADGPSDLQASMISGLNSQQ